MNIIQDASPNRQLAIVERYERFINYMYPILQNAPRKHSIVRDEVLRAMFGQVELFIVAGKSNQSSRLYTADANLSLLRFWLRFLVQPNVKIIAPNQHRTALEHLSETGAMLGAWIRTVKHKG